MTSEREVLLQKLIDKLSAHKHFDLVIHTLSLAGSKTGQLIRLCDLNEESFLWAHYAYITNQSDESSRAKIVSYLSGELSAIYDLPKVRAKALVEVALNEALYSKEVSLIDRASICGISRQSYYNRKLTYDTAIKFAKCRLMEWDLEVWLMIKPSLIA